MSITTTASPRPFEAFFDEFYRRALEAEGRSAMKLRDWVDLAEAWRIAQALRDAHGNRSAAARALGIGRRTLYSKMEKLGVGPAWGIWNGGERVAGAALAAKANGAKPHGE